MGALAHQALTDNLSEYGKPASVEGLTTFGPGTRRHTFVLDPDDLITREQLFYDADSLLASGPMR